MPPKKRSRISTAASPAPTPAPTEKPTPAADQDVEADHEHEQTQAEFDAQLVADPWTDDEETGLFKGLIKWKPTGINKHFHILSLQQYLLTNGYIHPGAAHTRIPGIWAKLRTLYDLDALDERENADALPWSPEGGGDDDEADELGGEDGDGGDEDEDGAQHVGPDFELPEEEYGDLMWRARFPSSDKKEDGDGEDSSVDGEEEEDIQDAESPPAAEELLARPDSPPVRFTPSFEIALSVEKPTPSRKAKTPAKGKAKTVAGRVSTAAAATRRSSRGVADSVDPDEEDDDDEEEEAGAEAEESGDESGAASTASGTPAPKGRARPAPRAKATKSRPKRKR